MVSPKIKSSRRTFLAVAGATVLGLRPGRLLGKGGPELRIGLPSTLVAPALDATSCLERYFRETSSRPMTLVPRKSYHELASLVLSDEVDCAWISGYALVQRSAQLAPLAAPVWRGRPAARSYILVAAERNASTVEDLAGDLHAFVDPESTSGFLLTAAELARRGQRPRDFFGRTFFTYSDRNVVRAIAARLADSGSCDAYVYEVLREIEPNLAGAVRILSVSEEFGASPIVVAKAAATDGRAALLRDLFTGMRGTAIGEATLNKLRLDRFVAPPDGLYSRLALAAQSLGAPT
jgi:phosphonate transport system substrate-binding protein